MSSRDEILATIGPAQGSSRPPVWNDPESDFGDLRQRFLATFAKHGGTEIAIEVARLESSVFVEPAARSAWGSDSTADEWNAEVGVAIADYVIAETGSVIVRSGRDRSRLSTLSPPRNILLVDPATIVATLSEGLGRLPKENAVMITGPSRTADIEGVLVRGVHGPGAIAVCFVDLGA